MRCYRRPLSISYTKHVTNEEVLVCCFVPSLEIPSQESHLPSQSIHQPSLDVFLGQLRDMKHQMSQMQQAQKFNVAKSHEQHVANAAWSEDLPSNTTMPAKLSSPISPNCMFSFLFMNIAHL